MCGIIGYVGRQPCEQVLLHGLQRLEYRGYDSAGIAVHAGGRVESVHAVGNLASLRNALRHRAPQRVAALGLPDAALAPVAGIGHTRWATHGAVTEVNAHPHSDGEGRVHIVLNGIVENHIALRAELSAAGARFRSQTDAEVVAHLIARHCDGDLQRAVRAALARLQGHFAFVALSAEQPGLLVGTRRECPLVVGVGDGESFVASAIPAFLAHTRRVRVLREGEVATLEADAVGVVSADGSTAPATPVSVDLDDEVVEKDGFETFMLKEIHEQRAAVAQTLAGWLDPVQPPPEIGIDERSLRAICRIAIVGCGSSYHAALLGCTAIERWAGVPAQAELASEFRYRRPLIEPGTLVIGITQSGETADTLAAMRLARAEGAAVLALTNVAGSQATREADGVLLTRAGIEIGVAATKSFTAQVAALCALALRLARLRGALRAERLAALADELALLPARIDAVLRTCQQPARAIAQRLAGSELFLYLGRLSGLPIALEGALKLKEISYIAADAYAAGEMKHGPIALLCDQTPVLCVATEPDVQQKTLSNIAEVRARGAHVVAIAAEGGADLAACADELICVPRTDPLLQSLLAAIPLQLLAYHVAARRGLDVDQPRNLAKTVTVE